MFRHHYTQSRTRFFSSCEILLCGMSCVSHQQQSVTNRGRQSNHQMEQSDPIPSMRHVKDKVRWAFRGPRTSRYARAKTSFPLRPLLSRLSQLQLSASPRSVGWVTRPSVKQAVDAGEDVWHGRSMGWIPSSWQLDLLEKRSCLMSSTWKGAKAGSNTLGDIDLGQSRQIDRWDDHLPGNHIEWAGS